MAGENIQNEVHDIEALWDKSNRQGEAIADLREITGRLEVGQTSMQNQMATEFNSVREAIRGNRRNPPNMIALATLAFLVMSAFGTVMVFLTGTMLSFVQRETDLRFQAVYQREEDMAAGFIQSMQGQAKINKDVYERMATDDVREQQDKYDSGYSTANYEWLKLLSLRQLDANVSLHEWQRKVSENYGRAIGTIEESNKRYDEHLGKEGNLGHPKPERVITTKNPLGVEQKGSAR